MIVVSACIVGDNCRYNGTCEENLGAIKLLKHGRVIKVCPEVLGGLPTPRAPAEVQDDNGKRRVINNLGEDVTEKFTKGALETLAICKTNNVKHVILKDRSPSCGKDYIYNGEFNGTLMEGNGITVSFLLEEDIKVYGSTTAPYDKILVYEYLDSLNIPFISYEHEPVFTVKEADELDVHIEGQHCKNLFLKDKKGKHHYLVIMPQSQQFRFKELETELSISKLSFGSKEKLFELLGVLPGSVGAFGLINDELAQVQVIISKEFDPNKKITFHPNSNDETLSLAYGDFIKFLDAMNNQIRFF